MSTRLLAAWLDRGAVPALQVAVCERALTDCGLCETPPGSNRGTRIDEYVKATGSPLGSYWCAAAVTAWFREAGAVVPQKDPASCDSWMQWAHALGAWRTKPEPGFAVVYGKPGDASHIGVVVRSDPVLLSVEANTSLTAYDRNGWIITLKEVSAPRVLGYVAPVKGRA